MGKETTKYQVCTKYRHEDDGYTIIEVLVAIAIFAIGMLAIASMQIGATQGTTTARSNTELTALAEDQMERLTRLPFDDDDLVANHDGNSSTGNVHTDDANHSRFRAEWWVTDNDDLMETKTVTLTARDMSRGRLNLTLQHIFHEVVREED